MKWLLTCLGVPTVHQPLQPALAHVPVSDVAQCCQHHAHRQQRPWPTPLCPRLLRQQCLHQLHGWALLEQVQQHVVVQHSPGLGVLQRHVHLALPQQAQHGVRMRSLTQEHVLGQRLAAAHAGHLAGTVLPDQLTHFHGRGQPGNNNQNDLKRTHFKLAYPALSLQQKSNNTSNSTQF